MNVYNINQMWGKKTRFGHRGTIEPCKDNIQRVEKIWHDRDRNVMSVEKTRKKTGQKRCRRTYSNH